MSSFSINPGPLAAFGSGSVAPEETSSSCCISVGIEGTLEPRSGKHTLESTGHFRAGRWAKDFALVRELGVKEVRYPIPWDRVERERGTYRWGFLDPILDNACADHRLRVIADPLHHTSYPAWLTGGFLNPEFPAAYADFLEAFAARYPMITTYTPFNEPTCTLDFCGYRGFWHPYASGDAAYVTMLRHTARGVAEGVHRIRRLQPRAHILHVDTFERHAALDRASQSRAHFLNERRFLFEELIAGRVGQRHPLYRYLVSHDFPRAALAWHVEHPVQIDERGGNYYPLNEEQLLHGKTHAAPSREPVGLARLAKEYARRLPYPLSLTETNIQGTVHDRITWLKYIVEQAEMLRGTKAELRRLAWYPLFDCSGWNSLLQGRRWARDPQGIFSCDDRWERCSTEFSRVYAQVAGGMPSAMIPAYALTGCHDRTLHALKRSMQWDWVAQPN